MAGGGFTYGFHRTSCSAAMRHPCNSITRMTVINRKRLIDVTLNCSTFRDARDTSLTRISPVDVSSVGSSWPAGPSADSESRCECVPCVWCCTGVLDCERVRERAEFVRSSASGLGFSDVTVCECSSEMIVGVEVF